MRLQEDLEETTDSDEPEADFVLEPNMSGRLFARLVSIGTICEMYEKRKFGRIKRAYQNTFNEQERASLERLYPKVWKWHMNEGLPLRVRLHLDSLQLLQRAAEFFGTI